jgi:hypothetical protein
MTLHAYFADYILFPYIKLNEPTTSITFFEFGYFSYWDNSQDLIFLILISRSL